MSKMTRMHVPISQSWLKAAEGNGRVNAMAAGAQRFLEALGEPTARFERARRGGRYVQQIVSGLSKVVRDAGAISRSGPQENARVAEFMLGEIIRAGQDCTDGRR